MRTTAVRSILLLVAMAAAPVFAGEPLGHAYLPTSEIEFYDIQGECFTPISQRQETGGMLLSKYPRGNRSGYVMGCWKPWDPNRIRAVFNDGTVMILHRSQIIRTGDDASRFSM